jgi:transketolase
MAEHSAHVAVALSCVEIISALYFGPLNISPDTVKDDGRDIFILSKGHGCMALYAVLARKGFIDPDVLKTYGTDGSILAEHPLSGKVPGVEFASGTLGHGLAVAAGYAKSNKLLKRNSKVFVLLGDGECDEGAVWEAAAAANAHCLDNLTAIVDMNGLQACGSCSDISGCVNLPDRWASFGWQVEEADGHDYAALKEIFARPNVPEKPRVIFCKTVKGKGIDFMENNLEWHYRPVRGAEKEAALRSLGYA